MTPTPADSHATSASPVIRYSSARYRLVIALGLLLVAPLLTYGVAQDQTLALGPGLMGVLLLGLFTLGVRDKLRGNGVALAREGDALVGGELERPLPIAGTSFEIVTDYEGGWVIVLRHGDATVRLGAGGWAVDGERLVTKAVAEQMLLALGLQHGTG